MKRRTFLIAALLTACTSQLPPQPPAQRQPDYAAPKTTTTDVASVVGSTNRFATAMWNELRAQPGNLAFSPASISLALNMTRAGARGETAAQMTSTLAIELDDDRAHRALGSLLHGWNHGERPYELAVANRLFGEKTMTFKKPFLDVTSERYGAALEPLSFKTAPEPSRATINRWVEGRTNDRIRDLLPEDSIKPNTALVLTNAIYFKGKWKNAFDPDHTGDAAFHAADGDVQVPMMRLTTDVRYHEADGMKMVELPYEGDALSMTIIVPDDDLAALQPKLDHDHLTRWHADARVQEVRVGLPRFKIDPPKSVKLKPMLIAMGMPDAFDAARADLSGIADVSPSERLVISEAYHKAFVEVNEEGTEAAGATAVVVSKEAAAMQPRAVIADRPFVFLIRDDKSGAILFMGRVANPKS